MNSAAFRPFASFNTLSLVPVRLAIAESTSPGRTTYSCSPGVPVAPGMLGALVASGALGALLAPGALGAAATLGASAAGGAAKPSAAASAGAPPEASARDAGIGMRTVSPRVTVGVLLHPFAASNRPKETPLAAATPAKVSPRRRR